MQNYNPYENMLNTLDVAAEKLGYTRSDYEVLRHPERELKVVRSSPTRQWRSPRIRRLSLPTLHIAWQCQGRSSFSSRF